MPPHRLLCLCALLAGCVAAPAQAGFIISSAIVEFTADGPRQQDIDVVSRTGENDYVVSEIYEIHHPDAPDETRQLMDDPAQSGMLVTPDRMILQAGGRKVLRFVLLRAPDAEEHIYRAVVKPVIKGVETTSHLGLKVLVGYEVMVIVRPAAIASSYAAQRHGRQLTLTNTGNTNILLQSGKQCDPADACQRPPVLRVYPGHSARAELPLDKPVTYAVWDGKTTDIKIFP
jgi:P pilus assembly chaperone PapD